MAKRAKRPKSRLQRKYERNKQKSRYGPSWDKIRQLVYKRDGFRCRACGRNNCKLNAHHIVLLRVSKTNHARNLITLCDSCHAEVEKRGIKILQSGGHKRDVVRMTYRFLIEKRSEKDGLRSKSLEEDYKKSKENDCSRV